jgi:4-hydroxy-tetrahydrodipicolinate reductase
MTNLRLLIVGQGNMAKELEKVCLEKQKDADAEIDIGFLNYNSIENTPLQELHEQLIPSLNWVVVHFGSGRQLNDAIELCKLLDCPMIQGSTRGVDLPENPEITIINAPNLSIPIIRLMSCIEKFNQAMSPGMKITIAESHQASKPDTSGTARVLADTCEIEHEQIQKIRDPKIQTNELGVPEENLGGHAYHFVSYEGYGTQVMVSTKIHGRRSYALGTICVAAALVDLQSEPNRFFRPGIYQLADHPSLL